MRIFYRIGKAENSKNKIPVNYNACCERNAEALFSGTLTVILKSQLHGVGPVIYFQDVYINYCPFCGAKIEFIKE